MKKFIFILIFISQITWAADLQIKDNIEGEGAVYIKTRDVR